MKKWVPIRTHLNERNEIVMAIEAEKTDFGNKTNDDDDDVVLL